MARTHVLPVGPAVDIAVKVRYAETDAQRVVYHGAYVPWFEVGRTEYCERVGYPYARMEAEGIFITVVELNARFRRSARYGDTVIVRTRFGGLRSRGCSFHYEVLLPRERASGLTQGQRVRLVPAPLRVFRHESA